MKQELLEKLFQVQLSIPVPPPIVDGRVANEEFERRADDRRLFYYVRTYPNNQLKLEVRELWASELPTAGELFKNGWESPHSPIPQLEPR